MNNQFDFKYLTKSELVLVLNAITAEDKYSSTYELVKTLNKMFESYINNVEEKYRDCEDTFEQSINKSIEMQQIWLRKAKLFKDEHDIEFNSMALNSSKRLMQLNDLKKGMEKIL